MAKRYVSKDRAALARLLITQQGITDAETLVRALQEAGFPADRNYAYRVISYMRKENEQATGKSRSTKRKAAKHKAAQRKVAKAAPTAKPASEPAPQPVAAAQPSPRVRSRVVQGSVEDKTLKKLQMIRDVQQAVGGKRAFRKLLAFLDRLDTAKD